MNLTQYRITGRAPASTIFRAGESISVNYSREDIVGRVALSTRYMDAGLSHPIPGELAVVVDAQAESVQEALTWITVGRELASVVSVAANASIAPLKAELVYDITPAKREREYFQRFEPADRPSMSSRLVPKEAAVALLAAIGTHNERDRLLRAIMQYNEALLRWEMGNELLVVAHLWMGVEAISKAYLRMHLEDRQVTKEELGHEWGYDPKRKMRLDEALDVASKLKLTCRGDQVHYRIAKDVSDSFEHGLANGGALFAPARDALVPIASHLREAILAVARITDEQRAVLVRTPYDRPRGPGGLEHYLSATLVGEGEDLAADGLDHPICLWTHKLARVALDEEKWEYGFTPEHNFTPQFAKGIGLRGPRVEIWDGGIYLPSSAAQRSAEADLGEDDSCGTC